MNLNNDKDLSAHQSFKDLKSSFNDSSVYYLNVEDNLVYDSFFNDFGPLNLAMIYRFIGIVQEQFKVSSTYKHKYFIQVFNLNIKYFLDYYNNFEYFMIF